MELLHAALAGFFLAEAVKTAYHGVTDGSRILQPYMKITLAALGAAAMVWLTGDTETWATGDTAMVLGASGGAVLIHRLARMLGAVGDAKRVEVLARSRR